VGCSAPGHLHTAPSFCRAHGNVTHGGPAGALVSSASSTRSTECHKGSPLGRVAQRDLFPKTVQKQRNSQDEVLGVFSIENLVINNFKRERVHSHSSTAFSKRGMLPTGRSGLVLS
jgi:hypothetical protein